MHKNIAERVSSFRSAAKIAAQQPQETQEANNPKEARDSTQAGSQSVSGNQNVVVDHFSKVFALYLLFLKTIKAFSLKFGA